VTLVRRRIQIDHSSAAILPVTKVQKKIICFIISGLQLIFYQPQTPLKLNWGRD
jgi:hypothetical protein